LHQYRLTLASEPQTVVRSLLRDRVVLQVRSVDRLFLQAYVPWLMSDARPLLLDRGFPSPSTALLGKIAAGYKRAIGRFARERDVPVVHFGRHESKEEVARPSFEQAEREGRFGVVLAEIAQERARVWAGWRRGGPDGNPHFEFGWQSRLPNYYYVHLPDREWARALIKLCCQAVSGEHGTAFAAIPDRDPELAAHALGKGFPTRS
jgi:hypothetical protein